MRTCFNYFLLLLVLRIHDIQAASPNPLYQSACTLVQSKIYCFFGANSPSRQFAVKVAQKQIFYLDLTSNFDLLTVRANWTEVSDKTGFLTDGTIASSAVTIADTTCLIDGGYNQNSSTVNITKSFDTTTNHFSTISNLNRNLRTPIYMESAVSVPNQDKIYFWGGLNGDLPGAQVSTLTVLDLSQNPYSWITGPALPSNINGRFGHTATLDNEGKNIFIIGGKTRNNSIFHDGIVDSSSQGVGNLVDMYDILIYNTVNASWRSERGQSEGSVFSRYMHTANLIPRTNQIIIYGGAIDQNNENFPKAVTDYIYYFDTSTFRFTERRMINEREYGPGPRFAHSAIIYKDTLFVFFGINDKGELTDEGFFLNINNYTWIPAYPHPLPDYGVATEKSGSGGGLDAKSIIGISIGSVLVILLILVAVLYTFYIKLKKQKEKKDSKDEDPSLPQLHKEYKRFSTTLESPHCTGEAITPTIYVDVSSDSVTLHDSTTPPRGFSTDQMVVVVPSSPSQKPNQVKDHHQQQQQPSFKDQFHNGSSNSSSSIKLSPLRTPGCNTTTLNTSVVKPSIS